MTEREVERSTTDTNKTAGPFVTASSYLQWLERSLRYPEFNVLLKQRLLVLQWDLYQQRSDERSVSLNSQCRETLIRELHTVIFYREAELDFHIDFLKADLGSLTVFIQNSALRRGVGNQNQKIMLFYSDALLRSRRWCSISPSSPKVSHKRLVIFKSLIFSWTYRVERWSGPDELQDDFMSALL